MLRHESPVHGRFTLIRGVQSVDDIDIALMMMDGDPEGVRWLLKKYGGKVKSGLRCKFHRVLADPEINEALNVATFNAFRAAHQYDESQGSLRAWFYKIAHNAALDILRGEKQPKAIPLEFAPPQPAEVEAQEDDHDHPEQQKRLFDLMEAIASLPKLQKAIIEADLASEEGVADAQRLAQAHGSTMNSIYVSRSQAISKLREDMRRRGYQTPSKPQRRGTK
jgi:RNA polymerase sigma factor (sigma-70 family)